MKNKKNIIYIVVLLIFLAFSFFTFSKKTKIYSKTFYYLGTVNEISLYTKHSKKESNEILNQCENIIRDIDNKMNPSRFSSDISKINNNSNGKYVKVSQDTFNVIKKALYFSDLSNGNFDISIGSLVSLWNIGNEKARVPNENEINFALQSINYKDIVLDDKNKSVMLKNKYTKLDLGGIAKGYAADKIVAFLKQKKLEGAIINLGGNIYTIGCKDNKDKFNIGIQDPTKPRGNSIGNISITNNSIVTSGIYERYIEKNGKIYHHILNPKTGYPIENELSSVTIISNNSTNCDALSTTTFSLGYKNGLKLIDSLKDTEAIFITKDKEIYLSKGIKKLFNLTDSTFTIKN